jgi:patatin-like phospholipase/acyl hydrolase
MSNKLYKILSIDGGGIRGIIPALILVEIEKRTGKAINELFDLVAGTSTGGIIAVCLNIPNRQSRKAVYSAEDLVNLFKNKGQMIFSQDIWQSTMTGLGILEEKYSYQGLKEVLQEYCGETELKAALTDILLTSYDLNRKKPFFFKSRLAKKWVKKNFKMKYAVRATTAAPTYFEPFKLLNMVDNKTTYSLVDGGIIANNPAMCAFTEALKLNQSDILMVSLGTGTEEITYQNAVNWGLMQWISPLLTLMINGNNETVDYQLREIFSAKQGSDYYRFQVKLPVENTAFDNTTPENIIALEKKAKDLTSLENNKIDEICEKLMVNV